MVITHPKIKIKQDGNKTRLTCPFLKKFLDLREKLNWINIRAHNRVVLLVRARRVSKDGHCCLLGLCRHTTGNQSACVSVVTSKW